MNGLDNTAAATCQQQKSTKRYGADLVDRNYWEDPNLSGNDCKVGGWMSSHNYKLYQPSLSMIAEKLHLSENTAKKCLDNLVANSYFLKTQVKTKFGPKNVYVPTGKIYTPPPKIDTLPPPKIAAQRKSNKGKAINIHDVVNTKHEPVPLKPIQTSSKKLGFKLARAIHGKKGYDFDTANDLYAQLLDKHGAGRLYPAMKQFISGYLNGRTVKFSNVGQIISEIPSILEKYGAKN